MLRLGVNVCGHPTIVHGGLTSALCDEAYGALLFSARREGRARFEKVFTAALHIDYLAPLPARATVVVTAAVESLEGRKLWLTAEVAGPPPLEDAAGDGGSGGSGNGGSGGEGEGKGKGKGGRVVYARSRSLFVIPRGDPGLEAAA